MGDSRVHLPSPPSPSTPAGASPRLPPLFVDDDVDGALSSPKTLVRRQMARRYWQPNAEASHCAIKSCGEKFGSWNVFSGRHHCRSCGRVVCASCSLGTVRGPPSFAFPCHRAWTCWCRTDPSLWVDWQRVMNPPRGESGGPSSVRVCDACFRTGQVCARECPCPYLLCAALRNATGSAVDNSDWKCHFADV